MAPLIQTLFQSSLCLLEKQKIYVELFFSRLLRGKKCRHRNNRDIQIASMYELRFDLVKYQVFNSQGEQMGCRCSQWLIYILYFPVRLHSCLTI